MAKCQLSVLLPWERFQGAKRVLSGKVSKDDANKKPPFKGVSVSLLPYSTVVRSWIVISSTCPLCKVKMDREPSGLT